MEQPRVTTWGLHGSPQHNNESGKRSSLFQFCITVTMHMHIGINTQKDLVIEKETCLHMQRKKYRTPQTPLTHTHTLTSPWELPQQVLYLYMDIFSEQTTTLGLGDARVRMKASEFCTLWSSTKEEHSKDKAGSSVTQTQPGVSLCSSLSEQSSSFPPPFHHLFSFSTTLLKLSTTHLSISLLPTFKSDSLQFQLHVYSLVFV